MGLFSSVIHVKDASPEAVSQALIGIIPKWKFRVSERLAMTGAPQDLPADSLVYVVSTLNGSWTTILESHCAIQNAPSISDIAESLSLVLGTYALALMVHDDDVLFYNLCRDGADLDGYNSNPQYFESDRLSDELIVSQRHSIGAFLPLLPEGVSAADLQSILDRGWWAAYNGGRLDDDGVQPENEPGFVFEGERMIMIGNFLRLHGHSEGYPFAGWAEDPSIEWQKYHELRFQRA